MNSTTNSHTQTPRSIPSHTAPRLDLYAGIHKAMRAFMFDTLERLGRIDLADAADRAATLEQVDGLLLQCRHHLAHENEFLHRAIEARSPTSSGRIADEHVLHVDAIDNLEDQVSALRSAEPAARPARAARLYAELALFIAENLEHMQREETEHNQLLWALYTDAELEAIHHALMASVPPEEKVVVLRWMAVAYPPAELAGLCAALRQQMPPEPYAAVLALVRGQLDDARRDKLAQALAA